MIMPQKEAKSVATFTWEFIHILAGKNIGGRAPTITIKYIVPYRTILIVLLPYFLSPCHNHIKEIIR